MNPLPLITAALLAATAPAIAATTTYQLENIADQIGPRGFGCFRTAHPDAGGRNFSCNHNGANMLMTVDEEHSRLEVRGNMVEVFSDGSIGTELIQFAYHAEGFTVAPRGVSFYDKACRGHGSIQGASWAQSLGNKADTKGRCMLHGVNNVPGQPERYGLSFWTGPGDMWARVRAYHPPVPPASIPLPATYLALLSGLLGLLAFRRVKA